MKARLSLTNYISKAMAQAEYEKLEDGTYFGKIPSCLGCIAFETSLKSCQEELQSVLEDWILLGFHLGHQLPIIDGLNINPKPKSRRNRVATSAYKTV